MRELDNKETNNIPIEKPLVLRKEDCYQTIVSVINDSNLPAFIIEPILKSLHDEIKKQMQEEYVATLNYYEMQVQSLQEQSDK